MPIKVTFISKKTNTLPPSELVGIFSNEKQAVEKTIVWLVKNRKSGFAIGGDNSILDTPQDYVDVYGRETWNEFLQLLKSNKKFELIKEEVSESEANSTPSLATATISTTTKKKSKNKTNKKNRKWWYYPSNQNKGGTKKRKTHKK